MPTEDEPQWTEKDRAYALAWAAEERERHTCGRPLSESMAKENQYKYEVEPVRCHACAARERAAQQYQDAEGADTAGLMFRFVRTPTGAV